jgi:hypothetical protein
MIIFPTDWNNAAQNFPDADKDANVLTLVYSKREDNYRTDAYP